MAPKNLASRKRRSKLQETRPSDCAGKEQSDEATNSDSHTGAAEVAAKLLAPPKKFTTPFEHPAPEPVENGSACSSPSASGFIIVPSQKPRRGKKTTKKKTTPASSKVFSDDDVISLLKGLAVFWANGRNNKWGEFHQFVKDDLPNQFTKTQISEKIRSLKKKFDANSEKARANEGWIDLSDPHESVVFELSKALWGDESGIVQEKGGMGENGDEEVVENDEGSKIRKKRKQVDEESKILRKREELLEEGDEGDAANAVLEEGDVRDAANTILSIRELVHRNGEGSKKNKKKKKKKKKKMRKEGDELNEKKEVVMERLQVEGNDEGNKISSKRKQVDGSGERNKKTRKMKLVEECGEASKTAREQKEGDDHEEEEEESLKEGKQEDEHDVKKDLAKRKQVDEHGEENDIPANQKQKMGIRIDEFQFAYPLLYASFDIFGPKVAMEECVFIGRENAQELEEKWRELNADVHRLELKKLDLMNRQGK